MLQRGVADYPLDRTGVTEPWCGEPEVWAELSCDQPVAERAVAVPAGSRAPVAHPRSIATISEHVAMGTELEGVPEITELRRTAAAHAAVQDAPVHERLRVEHVGTDGLFAVELEVWTGDGQSVCAGEDLSQTLFGVVDAQGSPVVAFRPTDAARVHLLDLDGDAVPETFETGWFGTTELRRGSVVLATETQPWCACAC